MQLNDVELIEKPDWVTYSSASAHRQCPNKWRYRYLLQLRETDTGRPAVERDFGTWWHALRAAEAIDRGRAKGTLKWCPEELKVTDKGPGIPTSGKHLTEDVMVAADKFWRTLDDSTKEEWLTRLRGDLPNRLQEADLLWLIEHEEELKTEEPIAVELEWERKLLSRREVEPTVHGHIDEVYYDTRRGMTVVRDHKTAKSLTNLPTAGDMMDSQLAIYAWGAAPILKKWGYEIRALSYDRIRSVKPREPVLTQSGTLSKSTTDYDIHTYRAWAKGPDNKGVPYYKKKTDDKIVGYYQEDSAVVEKLSAPTEKEKWISRTFAPLNKNVTIAQLTAMLDTYEDMQRTYDRALKNHDAPRNLQPACEWCPFRAICRAQMFGGAYGEYTLSDFDLEATGTENPEKR